MPSMSAPETREGEGPNGGSTGGAACRSGGRSKNSRISSVTGCRSRFAARESGSSTVRLTGTSRHANLLSRPVAAALLCADARPVGQPRSGGGGTAVARAEGRACLLTVLQPVGAVGRRVERNLSVRRRTGWDRPARPPRSILRRFSEPGRHARSPVQNPDDGGRPARRDHTRPCRIQRAIEARR